MDNGEKIVAAAKRRKKVMHRSRRVNMQEPLRDTRRYYLYPEINSNNNIMIRLFLYIYHDPSFLVHTGPGK